jgi:hypothetical protein
VVKKIWNDPVLSKVIATVIVAVLALVWAGVHFDWWKAALSFLVTTSLVPHWLLTVLIVTCLVLALVEIRRLWKKSYNHPRPRWFTWNELDWHLMGDFFAEGHNLKPESAGNLYVYIRGPFCRNPACKLEVPIMALAAGKVFAHSVVVCPCVRTPITIDFKRQITGISEERAVLVEACREAQAASRRGERFRASQ